jgi:hypothetical protein
VEEIDMTLPSLQQLFGTFHNLNLVFLMEDLRRGLATRGNWSFAQHLCPLAHGMRDGRVVEELQYLSQAVNLVTACAHAADELGARLDQVHTFIQKWDQGLEPEWLLEKLLLIWYERLEDAEAIQEMLTERELPCFHPAATCSAM